MTETFLIPHIYTDYTVATQTDNNCVGTKLMLSHNIHIVLLLFTFPRTVPVEKRTWPTIANPLHWKRPGRSVEELTELAHVRGYLSVHVRCYLLSVRSESHFRTDEDRELLESLLPAVTRGLKPLFA